MPRNTNDIIAGITLKERSQPKPSEIDLDYLINDAKVVKKINKHDYDIHINAVDLYALDFIESKSKLKQLLNDKGCLSIDKISDLKLLDLSTVGLGLVPDSKNDDYKNDNLFKYRYLNKFIDCVNQTIEDEKQKEIIFSEKWRKEHTVNLNKFDNAQCKNKVRFSKLYLLKFRIDSILKKIKRIGKKPNATALRTIILDLETFVSRKLRLKDDLGNKQALFSKLGMDFSEHIGHYREHSIYDLIKVLNGYEYILKWYNFFLVNTLRQFKRKKIKKISEAFTVDSFELKIESLNNVKKSNYDGFNEYNITLLYDYFRDSLVNQINLIIDTDIRKRKIIDGIFQYTPSAIGAVAFVVSLFMSFSYNYTLLKEMDKRYNLFIVFIAITLCAIIALINLYRNSKQFKRPKRKKFSQNSLFTYAAMALMFFSVNIYFINRYDGYDNTYYYVNAGAENIKIDGLVNDDKSKYTVPEQIDNLNVMTVSNKVFKGNKKVQTVDFSKSNADIGKAAFKNCTNLNEVILPNNMESIPKDAFKNCKNLTIIELNNIKTIGSAAFYGCTSLERVDISNVVSLGGYAFKNCENLGAVSFNDELSVISKQAFENCVTLDFSSLPAELKTIGKKAFSNCSSISSLLLNAEISTIGKHAFQNCTSIKDCIIEDFTVIKNLNLKYVFGSNGLKSAKSITINNCLEIPKNAFADYSKLTNIILGGNVSRIGKYAFKNCYLLSSITFNGECSYIGEGAFSNCNNLSSINFEKLSVSKINKNTFYNCSNLTSFDIPETVTEIGNSAFYGCETFDSINIPSSVRKIGNNAFNNCLNVESLSLFYINNKLKLSDFMDNKTLESLNTLEYKGAFHIADYFFDGCKNLSSLKTTVSPTSIGKYSFRDCISLSDFSFASSANKIGTGAFYNCRSLSSISLNDSISEIPEYAFYMCNSLEKIKLPANTKKVGKNAYYGCIKINELEINSNIKSVAENAFESCYNIKHIKTPLFTKPVEHFTGATIIKGLRSIEIEVTSNNKIPDNYLRGSSSLETISLNGNISSIGKYAFKDCEKVTDFSFIKTATKIGEGTFYNCKSLSNISLNDKISEIPDYAFYMCSALEDTHIPVNAKKIGKYAYFGCTKLNELSIGSSINYVGDSAFENCHNIKHVKTPLLAKSVKSFLGDYLANELLSIEIYATSNTKIPDYYLSDFKKLEAISLGGNITSMGKYAFNNCSSLKVIDIPNSVQEIKDFAFNNCTSLTEISIPKNVATVGDTIFNGCRNILSANIYIGKTKSFGNFFKNSDILKLSSLALEGANKIPDNYFKDYTNLKYFDLSGYEEIGKNAFNNTGLTSIAIPNNVKVINASAFANCKRLKKVDISSSTVSLSNFLFQNCSSLSTITGGENIAYIGEKSFENCTNLTGYNFNNVTSIGKSAFKNCSSLTTIDIPKSNVKIGKGAFFGCNDLGSIGMPQLRNRRGPIGLDRYFDLVTLNHLKALSIYDAKSISSKTFSNLDNVLSISLYGPIEKISSYSFFEMTKLESIVLPNSIKVIEKYAFKNCESLININIPNQLEKIEKRAFSGCDNITNIVIPDNLSYIGKEAFGDTSIVLDNTDAENQRHRDSWHHQWNNRLMQDDLASILEDISVKTYIVLSVVFISLAGIFITIFIKTKKRKNKK